MTREQKYAQQLKAMGIYEEAFEPEIHTLTIMERDHQRTLKAWKAEGSDVTSEIYAAVERQRKDILAHREALGLTPRGLRRLRSAFAIPKENSPPPSNVLQIVRDKYA